MAPIRTTIRFPKKKTLDDLRRLAGREGRSLNTMMVRLLEWAVAARKGSAK